MSFAHADVPSANGAPKWHDIGRMTGDWVALSGLDAFVLHIPGALPRAIVDRAFGAQILRPKGANDASPGQRPGLESEKKSKP